MKKKITILASDISDNLFLSARNIKNLCVIPVESASTYDLLDNNCIIADIASIDLLNSQLGGS